MKLPNPQNAVVDLEKLTDYLLNPDHPRGKHKARVLEATCGITAAHTDLLQRELIEAARRGEAMLTRTDTYGSRFVVDIERQRSYGNSRSSDGADRTCRREFSAICKRIRALRE